MQRIFIMKKLGFAAIMIGVYVLGLCPLLHTGDAFAQETLKITRDQFEFRDAPQANEDTLIGTLRIGTSVEWTGKTSGRWFEVKAPNGQIGWVHESGVSRPKTRIKPTPAPKKPSRPATSRSASSSRTQKTVKELEKVNARYKAQLQEKDRRITELSTEMGSLEEKLTDVAQMVEDHKQLLKLEELKSAEAQSKITELQDALTERDEESLTQKVEITKLQSQLKEFGSQRSVFSLERIFLVVSVLFNILALILLAHRSSRKRIEDDAPLRSYETERVDEAHTENVSNLARMRLRDDTVSAPDAVNIQVIHEDPHLKELDVVMEAPEEGSVPASEIGEGEPSYVEEDVVIDLDDVLPSVQTGSVLPTPAVLEKHESGIMSEEPEQYAPDEIILVEEPIQALGDVEKHQESVEEALPVSSGEMYQATEPEEPELYQPEEPVQALSEELAEIDPEPEKGIEEPLEELLEDTQELDQHAVLDDILEEGELEELETTPTDEAYQEVAVGGDTFEVLPKRKTQRIESEDENEDEFVTEAEETGPEYSATEDEEDFFMDNPGIIGDIEPLEEELPAQSDAISEDDVGNEFESSFEQAPRHFEPEDDIASTPIKAGLPGEGIEEEEMLLDGEIEEIAELEEIELEDDLVEEILEGEIGEDSPVIEQAAPSLLEPSPFVIEPENEPEERLGTTDVKPQEPKYDIELINVGGNPEHVLHILSKIEGLTESPQELVENAPCIIARGANKSDAQNFQIVMKKFGSDVRLVEQR